ncbi:MAG: UPF0104 family protein [Archaeoglobaceae archaeon]
MSLKSAFLGIALSIATIYIIFKATETGITWEVISHLNPVYLAIAFLFQVIFWLFWALRLRRISLYMGFKIPYHYSLRITLSSMFVAAITPSSAGGEPLRIKMLSENSVPVGVSTFIVLTERILDSIFFTISLPIFLIFTGFSTEFGFQVAVIFAIMLFSFLYILYLILKDERDVNRFSHIIARAIAKIYRKKNLEEKISKELKNFRNGTLQLLSRPGYLVYLFLITAFMWSVGFMIPSLILISMSSDPEFLLSYTSQLIIVIVSLIPITPGSSGLVEATMAYLYSNFVPLGILGSLLAIWRFITYHMNIIVGAVFLNFSTIKNFKRVNQK